MTATVVFLNEPERQMEVWEMILEVGIREAVREIDIFHRWDLLDPATGGFLMLKPRGWREPIAGEVPFYG